MPCVEAVSLRRGVARAAQPLPPPPRPPLLCVGKWTSPSVASGEPQPILARRRGQRRRRERRGARRLVEQLCWRPLLRAAAASPYVTPRVGSGAEGERVSSHPLASVVSGHAPRALALSFVRGLWRLHDCPLALAFTRNGPTTDNLADRHWSRERDCTAPSGARDICRTAGCVSIRPENVTGVL